MRFRDGCATVTGYELPKPLLFEREGGGEVKPESQDTGLIALVCPPATAGARFSVKEKDEASRGICFVASEMPSFPALRR